MLLSRVRPMTAIAADGDISHGGELTLSDRQLFNHHLFSLAVFRASYRFLIQVLLLGVISRQQEALNISVGAFPHLFDISHR